MSLFSYVIDKEYSLLVSGWYEPSKNTYLKGVKDGTDDKDLQKEIDKLFKLLEKYEEIEVSLIG